MAWRGEWQWAVQSGVHGRTEVLFRQVHAQSWQHETAIILLARSLRMYMDTMPSQWSSVQPCLCPGVYCIGSQLQLWQAWGAQHASAEFRAVIEKLLRWCMLAIKPLHSTGCAEPQTHWTFHMQQLRCIAQVS